MLTTSVAVYLVCLVVVMVIGNVGNILVISAVLCDKRLRSKEGNIFIMNLAIADLCVTAFVDPFSVAGVFVPIEFWETNSGLCHVIGCICLASCVCSLWTIAAISVNRYFLLCRNAIYRRVFTRRTSCLIILCLWLGAFCLDLPNFLDWGDHVYDRKTMACSYDRLASYSYTVFFISMFVTLPLMVVFFCNVNIYIVVRRSKIRVAAHTQKVFSMADQSTLYNAGSQWVPEGSVVSDPNSSHGTATTAISSRSHEEHENSQENSLPLETTGIREDNQPLDKDRMDMSRLQVPDVRHAKRLPRAAENQMHENKKSSTSKADNFKQEVKLAKTLFIIFTVFCVCWTPYALICLIDRYDRVPLEAYAYGVLLAHLSSTLNSILYALTNTGFRKGYKKVIRHCLPCCKRLACLQD